MRPRILFVCPGDGGRSRMAAAYLDHLAGDRYEAVSAGVDAAGEPHPEVVAAMADHHIEITGLPGTVLTPALAASARRVIGLGDDAVDAVEAACRSASVPLDGWGLPDPRGRPIDEVKVIRDTTRRLVERLIARLDAEMPRRAPGPSGTRPPPAEGPPPLRPFGGGSG